MVTYFLIYYEIGYPYNLQSSEKYSLYIEPNPIFKSSPKILELEKMGQN